VLEPCSKQHDWRKVTPELMVSHTREPVYFTQAVDRIDDQLGPCVWLEVGFESALPILRRALGKRASSHHLKSLRPGSANPVTALGELTADLWALGIHTQYWPFHHDQQQQYVMLNLPPYQFDKFRHWMDRIEAPTLTLSRDSNHNLTGPLKLIKQTAHSSEFQIDTECSEWTIACFDYRVREMPNCPLSFILALVLMGIGMMQSDSGNGSVNMAIRQFKAQCTIPSHHEKPLILTMTHDDRNWSFAIASANDDSTSTYVSGFISLSTSGNGVEDKFRHFQTLLDVSNINRLFTDPEADSVRGIGVYHSLAPLIQISKQRQNIKEVS
jgi:acyl transferase domain-containing protein